jgi:hypothetical protein
VVKITEAEFEELQYLRNLYKLETKLHSVKQLQCLENDIDAPIRSVVAMLALLGAETLWSCCGFDYAGQPSHKAHTYGYTYIVMRDTPEIVEFGRSFLVADIPFQYYPNNWRFSSRPHYGDMICHLQVDIKTGNIWSDPEAIHYSEPGTIAIGLLKRFLFSLKDEFRANAVIGDFNEVYRQRYPDWQYPALKPWIINRSEIIDRVAGELNA